ncbi:hypothetical protein, partial [Leclercia adecarboxylata]|uniref:hypothetical protein n=1 Tax=Leclercia adecarboxylata TaxID=83655 RepID=UPI00234D5ACB
MITQAMLLPDASRSWPCPRPLGVALGAALLAAGLPVLAVVAAGAAAGLTTSALPPVKADSESLAKAPVLSIFGGALDI